MGNMNNKIRNWISDCKLGYFHCNDEVVNKDQLLEVLKDKDIYLNNDVLEVVVDDNWFAVYKVLEEWELKVDTDTFYFIEENLSETFVIKYDGKEELIDKDKLINKIMNSKSIRYCEVTDLLLMESDNYYLVEAF